MTAQHTPGPWVAKFAADGCGDIGIVGDGGCLAECFHMIRTANEGAHEECAANARLIAAAPELLEKMSKRVHDAEQRAFEDWLARTSPGGAIEQVEDQWGRSYDCDEFRDEWKEELSVIAKATASTADTGVVG